MITQRRAEEIRKECQKLAKQGSWSDQLKNVVTPEEDKDIQDLLKTMSGGPAYVHGFYRFLNGTSKEGDL